MGRLNEQKICDAIQKSYGISNQGAVPGAFACAKSLEGGRFAAISKAIGDIIAAVDALLCDSIYSDRPELNELRNR